MIPSLSQPSQTSEENINCSPAAAVPPSGPEPPDLADKSSQSSIASFEDIGKTKHPSFHCFVTMDQCLSKVHITCVINSTLPGDGKDLANGDPTSLSSRKSAATRMVTRLRNPESKLSQLKNQQVAAAVHEANKGFKEGKEVRKWGIKFTNLTVFFLKKRWMNH